MPRAALPAIRSAGVALLLLLLLLLVAVAPTTPAAAVDDVTGDITRPEIVWLTLEPGTVDVATDAAYATMTGRFTDSGSGVERADLYYQRSADASHTYGAFFERISGDASDGIYTARIWVPRGEAPGQWPLQVQVHDRVRNVEQVHAPELQERGLPGYLDVRNADPDLTPPSILAVEVSSPQLDTRTGAATAIVRIHARDEGAGVSWLFVYGIGPRHAHGGVSVSHMTLQEGTAEDGWWEGEIRAEQYAHAGTWYFGIRPSDLVNNIVDLDAEELSAQGTPFTIEVVSHEDIAAPVVHSATLSPIELDVSDSDREVTFEARITDDLSGVADYEWDASQVHVEMVHPIVGQLAGHGSVPRVSGTQSDGTYRASFIVPQHSATGLWDVHMSAADEIGNTTNLTPTDLVEIGLPPTVLVYNTPLPPADVEATAGDAMAEVTWEPPVDARGAEVTEYVVREQPQGTVLKAPADARSLLVAGLDNGVEHTFVVHAVNKAGESDPSQRAIATPAEGLPELSPTPAPAPVAGQVTRLSGTDRITTAVAISRDGYAAGTASSVVLTRSDDYPDALAGTPLAAALDSPLLITPPGALDSRTLQEIERVLPAGATVHLLGGSSALSPAIEAVLHSRGYQTRRLAGADRYETAVEVAEVTTPAPTQILLATGRSYADALGAGAAAARVDGVVVLTDDDRLPAATAAYLQRNNASQSAVGGPAARAAPTAAPFVGRDRYETAVMVAESFFGPGSPVGVATGTAYPDALAGGAHAARLGAPLLLTAPTALPSLVSRHLTAVDTSSVYVYGGARAVHDSVLSHIRELTSR